MPANIFLYLGLAFAILELIQILPLKKILLPKFIQVSALIILNLYLIIFLPDINIIFSLLVTFFTLIFTLVPFLLNLYFNQKLLKENFLVNTRIPEILYLINWTKYSKSLITLKKVYKELTKGHLEKALEMLLEVNKDKDIALYNKWHQLVLNILLSTRNINLANSYLDSIHIDLDKDERLPVGLLYAMIRIYSEYGNFVQASECLNYLDEHYHDVQHRDMNLSMYLIFYALGGCEENFNYLLNKYPKLKRLNTLPYWRAILLLKTGKDDIAIMMLRNYLEKLPEEHKNLKNYIKNIINNPSLHTYFTEDDSEEHTCPLIVKNTFPPEDDFKHPDIFIYNNKSRISGTVILCGIVVLITVLEFIFALTTKSIQDFIFFNPQSIYDYIRFGGFSVELVNKGQVIRFISSIFLHAEWMHLLFNIYGLFILGRLVERSVGTFQLYFTFLISGITGNLLTYFFHEGIVGVGASGGVFGILGAFVVYIFWRRKDFNQKLFKSLIANFAIIIGINIFFGLTNPEINNLAHFGGFLGGILTTSLYILVSEKLPNYRKFYNILVGLISAGLFLLTLIFWYPMINYKYFDNMELTAKMELKGYEFTIPEEWTLKEKTVTDSTMIVDKYSNSQIYIHQNPRNFGNETIIKPEDIKEKLRNNMSNTIANLTNHDKKKPEIKEAVTEIDNGWYYYALERWSEDLDNTYYAFYYYKVFPSSICNVLSLEFKEYSDKFKKVLNRFLYSIEEK
ncbi:MAG: rhomboid family intramembrane serine protease [Spirochaetota bacterium]